MDILSFVFSGVCAQNMCQPWLVSESRDEGFSAEDFNFPSNHKPNII